MKIFLSTMGIILGLIILLFIAGVLTGNGDLVASSMTLLPFAIIPMIISGLFLAFKKDPTENASIKESFLTPLQKGLLIGGLIMMIIVIFLMTKFLK